MELVMPDSALRVLEPGLHTLIVDRGRPHARHLGLPVGGAADRLSFALGNALVGNPPDMAALEINLAGPSLVADCPLACVVFGAPFDLHADGRALATNTTFTLQAGEQLRIGGTPKGMRGYLCIQGGLETSLILESRSALAPLSAGMELPCRPGRIGSRFFPWQLPTHSADCLPIHCLEGAQKEWFAGQSFWAVDGHPTFTVTPASNRMGLRLDGPLLDPPTREMTSEPVCPGTVQITRDGGCILLGVDGQTIGGYPRIAQVIDADLDAVGQLRPGNRIQFVLVNMDQAERLGRTRRALLREWVTRLRTAEWYSR
jgi:antagonist of KipI